MPTSTPTSSNVTTTPTATPAPQVLHGADQYTPPTGLTTTTTAGGGTGYVDAQGNKYVQSAPGQYTLTPAQSAPATPTAPTASTTPNAPATPTTGGAPTPLATTPAPTPQTPAPATQNQGTYYYTKSQNAQGQTVVTYYDGNGNAIPTNPIGGDQYQNNPEQTPNAAGKLVQLPSAPTEGGFTQTPQTPEQINTQIQGEAQNYAARLDALQSQSDEQFTQFQTKFSQVQNGTYPLTANQQSLYNATQSQFDVLRQQMLIANQTYENGLRVFEARTGEAQAGTTTALGNLQAAINSDTAKIAELDQKESMALATLQEGFQKDNLSMITEAYKNWQSYQDSRTKSIQSIYDAVTKAQADLRDYTYKTAQDNITNLFKVNDQALNVAKMSWQEKQDTIDNILKQGQFDETKRKNLVDEAQKQQALNLQQAANDMIQRTYSNQALSGIPQTLPDGSPNPKYQDTFLSTLSPQAQNIIKGVADYSLDPKSLTTSARQALGNLTQAQALALVKQYDPSFSEGQYAIRNSFMKNWQVGGQNSVIQAANTSIDHLTKLYTESQALGNVPSGSLGAFTSKYNSINQWLNEGAQNPAVARFKQDALALAGEQARIYKNGSGSNAAPGEDEIRNQLEILSAGLAPDTAKSLIENGINLFTDRLTSAMENYQAVMGKPPSSILYQTAKDNIATLKSEGFNIDTSKLNPSPYTAMTSDQFLNSIGGNGTGTQSTSDFFGSMMSNANSAASLTQ